MVPLTQLADEDEHLGEIVIPAAASVTQSAGRGGASPKTLDEDRMASYDGDIMATFEEEPTSDEDLFAYLNMIPNPQTA